MERLTKIQTDGTVYYTNENLRDCFRKLCKLEDLEEQLGMPLDVAIQVFVLGERIYVKSEKGYCKVSSKLMTTSIKDMLTFSYQFKKSARHKWLYSCQYGEEWFLTKEEAGGIKE